MYYNVKLYIVRINIKKKILNRPNSLDGIYESSLSQLDKRIFESRHGIDENN
jgi:hypothetical protein